MRPASALARTAAVLLLLAGPAYANDSLYLDMVRCKAMSETASGHDIAGWEDLLDRAAVFAPDVDADKVMAEKKAGAEEGIFVAEMAAEPEPGFFQFLRVSRIAARCEAAVERLAGLEVKAERGD